MTAGLYTHYFILFVLVAWGLAAAAWWLRYPSRATLWPLSVAFALPILLLLPWVGVIVQRLGQDRSYWEGTLVVREVLEETLASWMVGHSVDEATAIWLGYLGTGLAIAGILLLAWRVGRYSRAYVGSNHSSGPLPFRASLPAPVPFHHWLLTVLWLLIPILGFLAVAWNRPKFQPRYLIFAAPAFIFCLSGLIGWLWTRKWGGRLGAVTVTLLLVGIFLFADWNLFNDYSFAKANWRDLAEHIAEKREPDEPILLVSGHVFPVFHYYYPSQQNVVRLPDERTLDITAVLGIETSQTLANVLQGTSEVWLVKWQDEVVDPDDVVPAILRAVGGNKKKVPTLMDVVLEHWDLPDSVNFADALRPTHPLDIRFGDALRLLGWSDLPTATPADEGLSLVLYWAAQRSLEGDYKVRLTVVDENGFEYGVFDKRPTSYHYPTFRWQPGDPRLATLDVPLQAGTPPGEYWVDVSVYREDQASNLNILDGTDAPQGQKIRIGPIPVAPAATGWLGVGPPDNVSQINQPLLDEQMLLAVRLAMPSQLEAGQRLPLTFWWRTTGALPGATLHLGWEQDETLLESTPLILAGAGWRGELWRPGDLLMTPFMVRVPRHIELGQTDLLVWISDAQGRQSQKITLTSAQMVAANHIFQPPTVPTVQHSTFDETIRLLGYDLSREELLRSPSSENSATPPSSTITLTVYWEALAEMEQNLTVFAHLLDANGIIVPNGGQDKLPLDGTRPTDSWVTGEFLTDTFTLQLPEDAQPGSYRIEIGWYDGNQPTFPRLPVLGVGADAEQDRVLLQTLVPVSSEQ